MDDKKLILPEDSVGFVKTRIWKLEQPLELECGQTLDNIEIAFETYGELNPAKTNAILVLHALSGDAHAAGYNTPGDRKPGWWDTLIGPGKAIDTQKYFIICSNVLGGCKGSTGPASTNPATGKPYGMDFPIITVSDMVNCQKHLVESFGITKLLCAIGGSLGGMQALQWAVSYPEMLKSVVPIATTSTLSAQSIAFNEVARHAIISDPNWNKGNYTADTMPSNGLALARMIGHITYLSKESMNLKFGRQLQDKPTYSYDFLTEFQVESYLHYQGDMFTKRFDANTYLYLTKAMDYFNLSENKPLEEQFRGIAAKFLVIAFTTDWLFPPAQSKEIVKALRANNVACSYCELESPYGHDAFLLEKEHITHLISHFLTYMHKGS